LNHLSYLSYLNFNNFTQDRHKYIGASDIHILCPELLYYEDSTPLTLYLEKLNKTEREFPEEIQNLLKAGKEQEVITVYNFLIDHGCDPKVALNVKLSHMQNKTLPADGDIHIFTEFIKGHMIAHPDLLYKNYNVECKYLRHKSSQWNFFYKKCGDKYGGPDDIPFRYWLQVQYQMGLTGKKKTIVAVNHCGLDFYYFKINFDKKTFLILEKKATDFMNNFVKAKTPPTPESSSDNDILFPNRSKTSYTLNDTNEDDKIMLINVQSNKVLKKEFKKKIKMYEEKINKINAGFKILLNIHDTLYSPTGEKLGSISTSERTSFIGMTELKKRNDAKKLIKYLEKNDLLKTSKSQRLNF
jgi:hypothetical protein